MNYVPIQLYGNFIKISNMSYYVYNVVLAVSIGKRY